MLLRPTFFWILPVGCALIALAFLLLWFHQRQTRAAAWAGAGFGIGALVTAIDLVRDLLPLPLVIAVVPLQWLTLSCLAQAHFVRHGKSWDWPKLVLALAVPFAVHLYFFVAEPNLALRLMQSFLVCGLILMVAAIRLHREGRYDKIIDRPIMVAVCMAALFYLVRGVTIPADTGISYAEWVGSNQMLAMYFGNALAALAVALLLMLAIGMDVIAIHFRETRVDPLTGIGNRRALDDAIAKDEGAAFGAALMIDLDRFKAVNDELGHVVGDALLVAVAQALEAQLGSMALVTRVGGEEFAVLIPTAQRDAAKAAAMVAHGAVAAVDFDGLDRSISASVGLAMRTPGESIRDTLRRADMALYRAKANGRNRLVEAEDAPLRQAAA